MDQKGTKRQKRRCPPAEAAAAAEAQAETETETATVVVIAPGQEIRFTFY